MTASEGNADLDGLVSSLSLAELARAGFIVLSQPTMQVAFEVHHVKDRPGYLRDVLGGGGSDRADGHSPGSFVQTLTTAAYGSGLVIGMRNVDDLDGRDLAADTLWLDRGESRVFRGTAPPNISFTYDHARRYEGLISVAPEAVEVGQGEARALAEAMHMVADAATRIDAPVLTLQAPVQLPPDVLPTGQDRALWPTSDAPAIRFAIGLLTPSADKRLKITEEFIDFCRTRGYGFWLNDTRAGNRAGSWYQICRHVAAGERRTATAGSVTKSLPVTLVGPARIGSTSSVFSYLLQFPEIGVISCSATAIDDLSFIHLQVTAPTMEAQDIDKLNETIDVATRTTPLPKWPSPTPPQVMLPHVLHEVLGTPDQSDSQSGRDLAYRAGDYQVLVGPAAGVAARNDSSRGALWVSWEVDGRDVQLSVLVLALHDALTRLGYATALQTEPRRDDANIEYLICRRVRNAALRGKGKLSFPKNIDVRGGDRDIQAALGRMSRNIEEAWHAELAKNHRVRELTVSWRENWGGHWSSRLDS